MDSLLQGLNEMQKEAVTRSDGPMLILAGAGSGKTRVLTHRIAYLMLEKNISPERILAVTFTNKAAHEMRDRVHALLGSRGHLPWLGTFHAVCVRILRREASAAGLPPSFTIYDTQDQKQLMRRVLNELRLDLKQFQPGAVLHFISGAKNELMSPQTYVEYASGFYQEQIARAYALYQKRLVEAASLDFDDILMLTVNLFTEHARVLAKYQRLFEYVLIDEYQDTNMPQYRLCKLLSEMHHNICVVGDDFQAIYSWRGANFRNILNFEQDYPDTHVIKLEQNYRSTKTILEGANAVIAKNVHRTDKVLWTKNQAGVPITVYEALNELDEAEFMIDEIQSLVRSGHYHAQDMAVLYRTNAQSRIIEEALLKFRMPYRIVGGLRFYERKEVKDALAYLRLVANPADVVSCERVINTPARGLGPKSVQAITVNMSAAMTEPTLSQELLSGKSARAFMQFRTLIHHARERYSLSHDLIDLFDFLMFESDYMASIDDGSPEGEARVENLSELKSVLSSAQGLDSFLETVGLVSDIDEYKTEVSALTLMTIHAAKGLEFPVVFLCGMEEGIFPHSRSSFDPSEIEEERRLCYVGMTRAKDRLYMLYAGERRIFGAVQANPPSRFLFDVPDDLVVKL